MLDPWIIEQIRRREEEERRRDQRPQLEVPRQDENWHPHTEGEGEGEPERKKDDDTPDRGVVIIDFAV